MQSSDNTVVAGKRPDPVTEVIYPTAGDRTSASSATATAATTATTTTNTSRTTTNRALQSTATAVGTSRKPLELDMTDTNIDSTSAPTPIHLTFHLDPEDESAAAKSAIASNSNAIAYLHSVHPALPVTAADATSSSSSTLQQPAHNRERRNSEGAATSVNGLWTPMSTEAQQTQTQHTQRSSATVHGDQVYASEAPVIPAQPMQGSVVKTNVHDHQHYDNRARVDRDAALATGAAAVAGATVAGSAATHRDVVRTQPLVETSGPQVVQVADVSNLAGGMHTPVVVESASAATGPRVVGSAHDVGGVETIKEVDNLSRLSQAERVAVAATAQRELPAHQVFGSTSGPQVVHTNLTTLNSASQASVMGTPYTQQLDGATSASAIRQVDDVSALTNATPIALSQTARPMVVGATQEVGSVERLTHVDDVSRLAQHERVAVASAPRPMAHSSHELYTADTTPQVVHVANTAAYDASNTHSVAMGTPYTQRLDGAAASSITHVDSAAALTGQRLEVARSASPLVVGETREVGGGQQVQQVTDLSRLSQAERVAVAAVAQHEMPARQVFTSTSGQVQQVDDLSRLSQAERVAVASVARGPAHTSHELYTADTAPQVVHTGITSHASHSTAMGTAYTQRLDGANSGPQVVHTFNTAPAATNYSHASAQSAATSTLGTAYTQRLDNAASSPGVVQVSNTQSLHGQRVDVGGVATAGPTVVGSTQQVGGVSSIGQLEQGRGERVSVSNTTAQTQTVQSTVQQQHVQQQVPIAAERVTVTREPVTADEAAANTTVRPLHQRHLTTQYADGTQQSLDTATQQVEYETRHETVQGGPVQVLHVDKAQLAGKNMEPLGEEAFSVAKEADRQAALDAMSGGVKSMQLEDREQQSYRKEEL